MLHRVEARAQAFFLCGVPFQIRGGRGLAVLRLRTGGALPSLQQRALPSDLRAVAVAVPACGEITPGMVLIIRIWIYPAWHVLERAVIGTPERDFRELRLTILFDWHGYGRKSEDLPTLEGNSIQKQGGDC